MLQGGRGLALSTRFGHGPERFELKSRSRTEEKRRTWRSLVQVAASRPDSARSLTGRSRVGAPTVLDMALGLIWGVISFQACANPQRQANSEDGETVRTARWNHHMGLSSSERARVLCGYTRSAVAQTQTHGFPEPPQTPTVLQGLAEVEAPSPLQSDLPTPAVQLGGLPGRWRSRAGSPTRCGIHQRAMA